MSIPQRRDGRKPRPPPDFVRNVVGSSAAAGSAEFHIFRNNRKREMDRYSSFFLKYNENLELIDNAREIVRRFPVIDSRLRFFLRIYGLFCP